MSTANRFLSSAAKRFRAAANSEKMRLERQVAGTRHRHSSAAAARRMLKCWAHGLELAQTSGRGLAIVGVVLSSLLLIFLVGMLF